MYFKCKFDKLRDFFKLMLQFVKLVVPKTIHLNYVISLRQHIFIIMFQNETQLFQVLLIFLNNINICIFYCAVIEILITMYFNRRKL